jgi:hypothetical protein
LGDGDWRRMRKRVVMNELRGGLGKQLRSRRALVIGFLEGGHLIAM